MKPLAFMVITTLIGTLGVYLYTPFAGVVIYYLFAVLRPQYIWRWSLPDGINWSFYVAMATIGAVLLGLHRRMDAEEPVGRQRNLAHYSMLVFAVWIAVTTATARHVDVAYPYFVEYAKIFVMYGVAACTVRALRQAWMLFVVTAVALAYIAYEVNYLYLVNHYLGIYHDGYGGLDNNGAGLMLAMGVPLCWFCYEGIQRWWRWLFVCFIPVLIHAVLVSYSRGAMLSLVVACPFILWRSRERLRLGMALAGLGFVVIPMLAGPEIRARFSTIKDNDIDASANSRRESWAAAWRITQDNPVFGVGVRNSPLFSFQYGADMHGRVIHSQYLQLAADNGLVGLALYLTVYLAAWLGLRRCRQQLTNETNPEARTAIAIANGVECTLVLYSFGALFLSTEVFELPYVLLLLAAQLQPITGVIASDEKQSMVSPREHGACDSPTDRPIVTTT